MNIVNSQNTPQGWKEKDSVTSSYINSSKLNDTFFECDKGVAPEETIRKCLSFMYRLVEAKLQHSHRDKSEEKVADYSMDVYRCDQLHLQKEEKDVEKDNESEEKTERIKGVTYLKSNNSKENLMTRSRAVWSSFCEVQAKWN